MFARSQKWARLNNYHWDEAPCVYAGETGNLKIIKWARENGCPWNKYIYA